LSDLFFSERVHIVLQLAMKQFPLLLKEKLCFHLGAGIGGIGALVGGTPGFVIGSIVGITIGLVVFQSWLTPPL